MPRPSAASEPSAPPLAGDHENDGGTFRLGAGQEAAQARMRLGLGETVQIDARVDGTRAANKPAALARLERGERWRRRRPWRCLPPERGTQCFLTDDRLAPRRLAGFGGRRLGELLGGGLP